MENTLTEDQSEQAILLNAGGIIRSYKRCNIMHIDVGDGDTYFWNGCWKKASKGS